MRYLGSPLRVAGDISGQVKTDETGWQEARITIPVRGSKLDGVLTVIAGRSTGAWEFTTLEMLIPSGRKRVDLVAGRVITADPEGYVEVHIQATAAAEYADTTNPGTAAGWSFSCVSAPAVLGGAPRLGDCGSTLPITALNTGAVDRFEVDLRFGKFNPHQTDLLLQDGQMQVPLTRTYTSQFWIHPSRVNAFGRNGTHNFDIAPVGSRKPYTYQLIVLSDGDFVYFPRVSRGGGYADAVYRHSETATSFYKAVTSWTGTGWQTRLADGSMIHFPESYNARNMAQGAPAEIVDSNGYTVKLIRDRQRNLRQIRTPQGREITLRHDADGRVVRAEAGQERVLPVGKRPFGIDRTVCQQVPSKSGVRTTG